MSRILLAYRSLLFCREAVKFGLQYPRHFAVRDLFGLLPEWLRSYPGGSTPLADERPWLTFAATRFLEGVVTRSTRVFEWGSGGSTLFFGGRAGEVISIEHDPEWASQTREALDRKRWGHCRIRLIEAEPDPAALGRDPSDPAAYGSGFDGYEGQSFRRYVEAIDEYPDRHFDLILIDGRARPSCFAHSACKIKPGGYIVWDNTEREHYWPAMRAAPPQFRFLDFPGPVPYANVFLRTSAWQAPSEDSGTPDPD
jgi:hypothetical protein